MRAWRLRRAAPAESSPLLMEDVPDPEPGPGEAVVKVSACGVCRTDLHLAEGELEAGLPLIPGHQVVGTVEGSGPGAKALPRGARVGACWLHWACGACPRCREGAENLCPSARFTGWTAPGGFAERLVVPEAFLHPLPERFSDAEAAPLLCAGAIGWRAWKACGARKGERLGLYGFGSSAHLVLQLARHAGQETFVFTRGPERRRLAGSLGAFWTGEAGAPLPFPLDGAILFAPSGSLVPAALKALRPGGRLVLAGIHMTDLPSMPYKLLRGERSVSSVAHVRRCDVRHLLAEAAGAHLKPRVRAYPFAEANRALADLKAGAFEGSAVLVL